ncbi:MAG: chorismate synthase [Alphaproteobacteria bacterium]|nr:chorismate synthase [Alphaproteobacteria bacterium]MBU1525545.1 chorismate synthase [Alphaproteobacteria bacterium]MBU2117782.1 chorismate synthase [Alphaproteobacteria bacterium]MBU2350480.1 chorismate synthase [Alphaproteobacteria bacterium]MBU2381527.1 chorismate synthase [Alphaproteobacteria bacterium]
MSHNTFGHLFRVTTWGESHGPAIGCVVDGCPPGIALTEADLQPWLDRRKPGGSRFVTQRKESDAVRILSGTFDDGDGPVTTGTPISLLIQNEDARSKDYGEIARAWRPGHADFTYDAKYGVRDPRGGGRSSARETAMRVAAGAVARKVLGDGVTIRAGVTQLGPHRIPDEAVDFGATYDNPLFAASADVVPAWSDYLDGVRKAGSSIGAVVSLEITGAPSGWGAPVYGKLDAELTAALMSINAVKGVEIGAGFASAELSGEDNADQMRIGPDGQPVFLSNKAGGVLGGISTGQPITARVAFKPTSSILTPRQTVTRDGTDTDLRTIGRHDPCVALRGVPVVEAMAACVLADALLRHRGQVG